MFGARTTIVHKRTSPKLVVLLLSRAQKYEEKRRQYLAAKRGSTSDEPRVRFQETRAQGAPVVSGHPPANTAAAFLGGERNASITQPQSYEQRGLSKEPPNHVEDQWMAGVHEPSERQDQTHMSSTARLCLPEQSPTTAVAKNPNAEYAKQLREQMTADSAAAQRAKENEGRPAVASTTLPEKDLPHAREAAIGGPGPSTYTAIDRKAEYAHQLREQMAADEATRYAMETERKNRAAPSSSSVVPASGGEEEDARGGGRSVRVGGQVKNAKAESPNSCASRWP